MAWRRHPSGVEILCFSCSKNIYIHGEHPRLETLCTGTSLTVVTIVGSLACISLRNRLLLLGEVVDGNVEREFFGAALAR